MQTFFILYMISALLLSASMVLFNRKRLEQFGVTKQLILFGSSPILVLIELLRKK
jgi:hypothetical protein